MKIKRQVAFNAMVRGLAKQQEVSQSGGSCQYRGQNGTKCAIGFLITDKKYDPQWDFEMASASRVFRYGASTRYYGGVGTRLTTEDQEFLTAAQAELHDQFWADGFDKVKFKAAVHSFALKHNLKVPTECFK